MALGFRPLPLAGGGLTNYTITADADSYSHSGTAASLELGLEVVAAAGSYALTGTEASLGRGLEVAADVGSSAHTGTTASLEVGREVTAAVGAYAHAGADAVLDYNNPVVVIAADAGSYVWNGQEADTLVFLVYDIAANAGSYEHTGANNTLARMLEIDADASAYALTGTAASLERGAVVAADAGSYSATGTAASLELGREVLAEAGAYAHTGQDAALTVVSVVAFAEPGQIEAAGQTAFAATTANITALVEAGASEIAGATPQAAVTGYDTFLRPAATQSTGSWETETGGSNLHASIDEAAADDGDYIRSPDNPVAAACVVQLQAGTLNSAQPTSVLYRYRKEGAGTLSLTVRLLSPLATERASAVHPDVAAGFVDGVLALTEAEAASVDWADAYLAFVADAA